MVVMSDDWIGRFGVKAEMVLASQIEDIGESDLFCVSVATYRNAT